MVSQPFTMKPPITAAVLFIVTGSIGWFSSFALVLDKIAVLKDPSADLDCNFSPLVQCGKNLASWQGSLFFGVSNPIWGLGAFAVPIVIGVAILAGASFARWFWWGFEAGVVLGLAWVIWFQYQSIFIIGTLCPWCMTMWAAMIPLFWTLTIFELKSGIIPLPDAGRRFFAAAWNWLWVIVVLSYVLVAIIAQLRLDLLSYL